MIESVRFHVGRVASTLKGGGGTYLNINERAMAATPWFEESARKYASAHVY